jgi:hypothetical protein
MLMRKFFGGFLFIIIFCFSTSNVFAAPLNVSGIYPHLAMFGDVRDAIANNENESGIGGVVFWANKIWVITYPPHKWNGGFGSALYYIDPENNFSMTRYTGSVGGTHAARMIHQGSNQLIMGPYFIKNDGSIRAISPTQLPGRLTAVMKDPTDDTNTKVIFYTMEQGLYRVDVNTLQVEELHRDANKFVEANTNNIPNCIVRGAHGKGGYSGQGRLIIANNGMPPGNPCPDASFPVGYEGGVLAEWNGQGDINNVNSWVQISPNKFTDVTGPGGISGSSLNDPVWSIGWDARSTILKLLDNGVWYTYRLPKTMYSYDSRTGWLTEWPRIHQLDSSNYLMNMFGMFYKFPKTFSLNNSSGIFPVASHLQIVSDITKYNDKLVLGGDDTPWWVETPNNLFSPGNMFVDKPNSNLRFVNYDELFNWGMPYGNGGPWYNTSVVAGQASQPYLLSGFDKRVIHFVHNFAGNVNFTIEIDSAGDNNWTTYQQISVPVGTYKYLILPPSLNAVWIRFKTDQSASSVTTYLSYSSMGSNTQNSDIFKSLASGLRSAPRSEGIIVPKNETLEYVANVIDKNGILTETNYYEIGETLNVTQVNNPTEKTNIISNFSVKDKAFTTDSASVILIDNNGVRYRLPKGNPIYDQAWASGWPRPVRSVPSEYYLMNIQGTFYVLPRPESGGLQKIRPIATHNKMIYDFASWRGMLVMSGSLSDSPADGHYYSSSDGKAGLWFGNIDDLWKFGAPYGIGGPWMNSSIVANVPSDQYLMAGYLNKSLEFSHVSLVPVTFTLEVDFTGDGNWVKYDDFIVQPNQVLRYDFPDGYNAYWVRLKTNIDTTATAKFIYSRLCKFIGDVDCSSVVDLNDVSSLVLEFGNNSGLASSDFDSSGKVNSLDLSLVLADYGKQNLMPTLIPTSVPTATPIPKQRILKQALLGSSAKRIWTRYQYDDFSWSAWGDFFEDLPIIDGNSTWKSFDHLRINPSDLMTQSMITADGKQYYWRKLTWDGIKYNVNGDWVNSNGSLLNIPNVGDNKVFHSFDQSVLADGKLKQSLIENGSGSMLWRKCDWDSVNLIYSCPTGWSVDSGIFVSIKTPQVGCTASFNGFDNPSSVNHVLLADGRVKQTVLSNDGTKIISRIVFGNTIGCWGAQDGEMDLKNLIPGLGDNQTFLSYDETTMP